MEPFDAILTEAEYDGLDEARQGAYRQLTNDELKAGGLQGVHYAVNVKSKNGWNLEPVGGLKSTLAQKKSELEKLAGELDRFKEEDGSYLDAESARAALTKLHEIETWNPDEKAKEWAQNEIRAIEKKFSTEKSALISERDAAIALRNQEAVRNEILRGLSAHGVDKDSVDILFDHFERKALPEASDGRVNVYVRGDNGEKAITHKPGESGHRTMEEEIAHFKDTKQGAKFFAGSGQNGKGNTGTVDNGNPTADTSGMSPQQKLEMGFAGKG